MLLRLSGADTVEKVANIAYETCMDLFSMDSCRFATREPDSEFFQSVLLADWVDGQMRFFPPDRFADPDRARFGAFWCSEPVLIDRSPADPGPDHGSFGDSSRPSAVTIMSPIVIESEILGMLSIHSYTPHRYDERDSALLKRITDAIGPALERCRAVRAYLRVVAAIEQSTDGIIITDPDWRIVYANPTFVRMTGYTAVEVLGRHPRELLRPKDESADQQLEIAETLARGESWTGEWKCRRKDGSEFDERVTLSPVQDENGRVVNYLAVRRDISREIATAAEMRQAQKMEAVGSWPAASPTTSTTSCTIIMGYAS